jgi:AcrR family transcriptional regulator
MASSTNNGTPLERALAAPTDSPARATPLDALRVARRMWLRDQRIDMGALASELGVSRATLYNWVGDRERLTAEVLWSMAQRTLDEGREVANGKRGAEYLSATNEHYLTTLAGFDANRRFIERDPEFALRILASRRTPFQRRLIEAVKDMIVGEMERAGYEPALDPDTLAYLIVRVGESFIFNDVITGAEPDLDKAIQASQVLFYAEPRKRHG